jgi:hypothetical protein
MIVDRSGRSPRPGQIRSPPASNPAWLIHVADISIKQPVFITMVVLALAVVGGLSYSRPGVDLMPASRFPSWP